MRLEYAEPFVSVDLVMVYFAALSNGHSRPVQMVEESWCTKLYYRRATLTPLFGL